MPAIFQKGTEQHRSNTLIVGAGLNLAQNGDGLPEISSGGGGEAVVNPSGADDTVAIGNAVAANARVRLASGVFTVSGIIDVPAGVVVTGSGSDKTRVNKTDYNGAVFRLGDATEYAAIENLRIVGPGKAVTNGNVAITAARSTSGLPVSRRLRFANLHIEEIGQDAIYLDKCGLVDIENCVFKRINWSAIYAKGAATGPRDSYAINIARVRVEGSGTAVHLHDLTGAALVACEVESCWGSYKLNGVTDAVVAGCISRKCEQVPLLISGGSNIVVNAFSSDNVGTPYFVDHPHLVVDGGAVGVHINGFRRINTDQPGTLTHEANVSAAGARVLVGQHDFTIAKINSGGKFAEITSASLP